MRSSVEFRAWTALFAVYFFWGTTYLAIRMALESFPPVLLIGVRFFCSGLIMLIAAWLRGAVFPSGRELWLTALFGIVLLGGGNGSLVIAEVWVPSGTAALFITTSPFWMVGIEALLPGGEKLHLPTIGAILLGLAGVLFVLAPGASREPSGPGLLQGFLLLQFGCLCWCSGSLLQRRLKTKAHPAVSGAVQQFATGLTVLPIAMIIPEHPIHLSMRGFLALAWLVTFGSIVGYTAFIYAMEHLPVAVVSTYTYVNPIVAVFLGWLFYREHFGVRELIAMTAVFAGVALVKYFSNHHPRPGALAQSR